jgi:hypothetical protein
MFRTEDESADGCLHSKDPLLDLAVGLVDVDIAGLEVDDSVVLIVGGGEVIVDSRAYKDKVISFPRVTL